MGQIIGYRKFKSKKGNDCVMLKVLEPANPHDMSFGHYGNVIKELFVPENQHSEITDKVIGHECEPHYNYGYLESVTIK